MNWARLLRPVEFLATVVLIVAHAALHALDCYFGWHSGSQPFIRDALPFSQFALLLIWLVVGPSQWRVRGLLVLCWVVFAGLMVWRPYLVSMPTSQGFTALTVYVTTVMWDRMPSTELRTVAAQSVAIAVALAVIRLSGFALRRDDLENGRELQFSLRTLMILTGASAVAMWLAQLLRSRFDTSMFVPEILGIGSLSLAFAAVALLAVWAAFGGSSVLLRLVIFGTATLVLGAFPPYVCHRENDLSAMMSWVNTHGMLVAGSLLVVRSCGYRLVRVTRAALQLPSAEAARKELIVMGPKG